MAGRDDITTYEQLQALSPREQHDAFRASLVLDPAEFRDNERELVRRLDELTVEREERLRGQAS